MMNANAAFREDEIVVRKQKVNGEWVDSYFPRVGGRLRLAHEGNGKLSIQAEVVQFADSVAVVRATVTTEKGSFCGYGSASASRDQKLADSLLELAETRSIARALRFSGYGMEYTSFEEVTHVVDTDRPEERSQGKQGEEVFHKGNGESKPGSKRQKSATGTATSAQVRALHALTRRAGYTDADIENMLAPYNVPIFEALSRDTASRLISYLQTEAAA